MNINLFERTCIMGVLNITPDSFSDGNQYYEKNNAIEKAYKLIEDGADILDIGGESTRPGANPISAQEELDRIMPVLEELIKYVDVPISVDTYKSPVAEEVLKLGVEIINDISGFGFDVEMPFTVSKYDSYCVLMHTKGRPKEMQKNPIYDDLISDIFNYLFERINIAEKAGVNPRKIIIDPGIGFGKSFSDNIEIHKQLPKFKELNKPIMFGSSRKSFLGEILNLPVEQRIEGTIASCVVASINGANILRVHDVKQVKRAALVLDALK